MREKLLFKIMLTACEGGITLFCDTPESVFNVSLSAPQGVSDSVHCKGNIRKFLKQFLSQITLQLGR
jgi:hypothetical protein